MIMRILGALSIVFSAFMVGCASSHISPLNEIRISDGAPRTHKVIHDGDEDFHFVVLGDRTAGPRAGVFEKAVLQANLLNPAFVFGVGDLIEGHSEDRDVILRRWDHIDGALDACESPFFYVVGNNDISNETMREIWEQRHGRRWYKLIYKDVLFIVLDTEDPPKSQARRFALRDQYPDKYADFIKASALGRDHILQLIQDDETMREIATTLQDADQVNISQEQLEFVSETLRDTPDVRHTFIFMHRPAWKYNSDEFRQVEDMLSGRQHTFIAGHYHKYEYVHKNEADYIQMGPTGGQYQATSPDAETAIPDHLLMISMRGSLNRADNPGGCLVGVMQR